MKTGGSLPVLKLTFKADGIWPLWYASGPGVKLICGECRREVFAPSYLLSGSFSSRRVVKNITMGTPKVSPEVISFLRERNPRFRGLTLSWEIVKCPHAEFSKKNIWVKVQVRATLYSTRREKVEIKCSHLASRWWRRFPLFWTWRVAVWVALWSHCTWVFIKFKFKSALMLEKDSTKNMLRMMVKWHLSTEMATRVKTLTLTERIDM